jgi:hypothetical protein
LVEEVIELERLISLDGKGSTEQQQQQQQQQHAPSVTESS